MCWSSTRTTLVLVSLMCMYMNGFNLTSRLFGFYDILRRYKAAEVLPDVTDLSKWVNGRRNSNGITMGLAGVSLFFDVVLLTGALKYNVPMIEIAGLWGAIDCVADAVIGFLSANYTMPALYSENGQRQLKSEETQRRERQTAFARQFFHFSWVLGRLGAKSQILCSLFEYVHYLNKKDAVIRGLLVTSYAATPHLGY
ncbi:uncharacterized protein [Dermacentor andersoni]|uniref:uncharacterized protein n=1 Tax=Dermacentor andersoni TaxID=34620 RepID=UPI0024165CA3|nr:uncharacterized protein LOC129382639 [Dermacentor andersoni]